MSHFSRLELPRADPEGRAAGPPGEVTDLAAAPDGRLLAAAGADGAVRLWSLPDGAPVLTVAPYEWGARAVAWCPDGLDLAAGAIDGPVVLIDPHDGRLTPLPAATRGTCRLSFTPDGAALVGLPLGGAPPWLARRDGGGFVTLRGEHPPAAVAVDPRGAHVAVAPRGGGEVRLYALPSGEPGPRLAGHRGRVSAVQFTADGAGLVSAGEDGQVIRWRLDRAAAESRRDCPGGGYRLALDGAGYGLAVGTRDGQIRVWAGDDPAPRHQFAGPGLLGTLLLSAGAEVLVAAGHDGRVCVWQLDEGRPLLDHRGPGRACNPVALTCDGTVAVGDRDGRVTAWVAAGAGGAAR